MRIPQFSGRAVAPARWCVRGLVPACVLLAVMALFPAIARGSDSVVTFNEIMYNPPGAGDAGEWLELHNMNAVNVDLSGWRLAGGIDYTFPAGTVIQGKGLLVVAKTPGVIPGAQGPFTGLLDNGGERLTLRDNNERLMDEVTYGDAGDWPIAPDGSGVSLAKRAGYLGSGPAASWTSSGTVGGTPGVRNFVPPAAGGKTAAIPSYAAWKYDASGADPGPSWMQPGFDDSAWASGASAHVFGTGTMYEDPPPASTAQGYWTVKRWTNDADSGVSTSKTYTHKVDFNRLAAATAAVINGVTFDKHQAAAAATRTGTGWTLTGAGTNSNNSSHQTPANNSFPTLAPDVSAGSRALTQDFYYGNSVGGISKLEMTGLTPGQFYVFTLYALGWDVREARRNRLTPSDTGTPLSIDEDYFGQYKPLLAQYHYRCPASGKISVDFLPLNTPTVATWHHYGFSNEVASSYPQEVAISTTPAVADVSSEFALRGGVNALNGSGLATELNHATTADNVAWLTAGAATDPAPWQLTADLGAPQDLTSLRIWNYNEMSGATDLTGRGMKDITVLVSPDATGETFTSAGTYVLERASGDTTEAGQRVPFASTKTGVRRVRITATTNWGDATYAGLSEVKFYKLFVPDPTPVPAKEAVAGLFNTGMSTTTIPAPYGTTDPHWTAAAGTPTVAGAAAPPVVSTPHSAWLAADGVSNFIGFTGTGTDSVPFGQFTFSTTMNLSQYIPGSEEIRFYTAVDNIVDYLKVNGTARPTLSVAGFATYLGPYTISGPFNAGSNTLDFVWTNSGTANGPGALRVKWDARARRIPGTTLAGNPVTTYFRKAFTMTGGAESFYSLVLEHALDDGAVFYLNGTEIYRTNMPAGPVTASTLAASELVYPRRSARIPLSGSAVVPGVNVLAVELHQATAGNADAYFDAALDIFETPSSTPGPPAVAFSEVGAATSTVPAAFLELKNGTSSALTLTGYSLLSSSGATADLGGVTLGAGGLVSLDPVALGLPALDGDKFFLLGPGGTSVLDALVIKRRAQAIDGAVWRTPSPVTPGAANSFALNDAIVINEIMHKHAPAYLPSGVVDDPEQWFELYNKSAALVSLAGWSVKGGLSYDFGAGASIPAGGYLVVAKDSAALAVKYPAISIVGNYSGSLGSEDVIRIEDENGNTVDEVHYYGGGRWDDRASGGGSSLELRDPRSDNSQPEAWAASDESGKVVWQSVEYSGLGAPTIVQGTTVSEPAIYNELILGLVAKGECLVDDVSVVVDPASTNHELIQNGSFESGASTSWRLLGTHGLHGKSVVVPDPVDGAKKVLKIYASDSAEHMHNHCETTLKDGASFHTLSATSTYRIKFRARWVSGSPRLNSRLYFNRLPLQAILPMPTATGTPGAANSRLVANAGPTFSGLNHAPILPGDGQSCRVRLAISDPDGIASAVVKYRLDPGTTWASVAMSGSNGGVWEGIIAAQAYGSLVQFYVEAADAAGAPAVATFPAGGAASGAFIRWDDGLRPTTPGHEFRFLMAKSLADIMHSTTQAMSNHFLPATVVYQGTEVFYDAGARLKSSERGRLAATRLGFALEFDDMHLFRGVNGSINLDRSGIGLAGGAGSNGHGEIASLQYINHAGGVPGMINDMVYVIAPRSDQTGSSMLTMAEFNDNFLDGQFENGGKGAVHKMDYIYYPTTTDGGTAAAAPEGLKIANPDLVVGVSIPGLNAPANKEAYRWTFLTGNATAADEYTGLIALNQALRVPQGPAFVSAITAALDVDEYLRASAAMVFTNATDHYSAAGSGQAHNLKLYTRPSDGRVLYLPWDHDYQSLNTVGATTATSAIVNNGDLSKIIAAKPEWERAFWGHLHDIMNRSFNRAYMDPWIDHFSTFSTNGGNWANIKTWIDARRTQVLAQCATKFPAAAFTITTNGGADFSDAGPLTTLSGSGWVDVRSIRQQGSLATFPVTWSTLNTWSVQVPVAAGTNLVTLEAVGYNGTVVGTDTITITGTGAVFPAAAANTALAELMYNPPIGGAEFIKLRNMSDATIDFTGCQFDQGVTWTYPAAYRLAPGASVVIAQDLAAFAAAYPGVTALGPFTGGLSNGGETLRLLDAEGSPIFTVAYPDSIGAADGGGYSLVRFLGGASPDLASYEWFPSQSAGGNPGSASLFAYAGSAAAADEDTDADGWPALLEYAFKTDSASAASVPGFVNESATLSVDGTVTSWSYERRAGVTDLTFLPEASTDLGVWSTVPGTPTITPLPEGRERITYPAPAGAPGQRFFFHIRVTRP